MKLSEARGRERLSCHPYLWPRQRTTTRDAHDLTGSPRCHEDVWGEKCQNVKMSSLSHLGWEGREGKTTLGFSSPFCPSRKIHIPNLNKLSLSSQRCSEKKGGWRPGRCHIFCCMCARSNSAGMISNGNAKDASTTFLLSESTQVWTLCWWTPNNC